MDKYLALGSVVLLKGGNKRLMIYGRRQIDVKSKKVYDYVGCLFPEGNITPQYSYMFNRENIEDVYFIGLKDAEEMKYEKVLRNVDKEKVNKVELESTMREQRENTEK